MTKGQAIAAVCNFCSRLVDAFPIYKHIMQYVIHIMKLRRFNSLLTHFDVIAAVLRECTVSTERTSSITRKVH